MKNVVQNSSAEKITAITNVRIFDGEKVIESRSIVIKGETIIAVGGDIPGMQQSSMLRMQHYCPA